MSNCRTIPREHFPAMHFQPREKVQFGGSYGSRLWIFLDERASKSSVVWTRHRWLSD
jgi:hypothetical protein